MLLPEDQTRIVVGFHRSRLLHRLRLSTVVLSSLSPDCVLLEDAEGVIWTIVGCRQPKADGREESVDVFVMLVLESLQLAFVSRVEVVARG